jgi:hypothetical protein
MSGSAPAIGVSPRRRAMISRGWRAGVAVGLFSALLFTLASHRLQSHGYVVPPASGSGTAAGCSRRSAGSG